MSSSASPWWSHALTLKERLAELHARQPSPVNEAVQLPDASERLEEWRKQAPFEQADLFQRRLAADGIREDELARILGESADPMQSRTGPPPAWLSALEAAFASARPPEGAPSFADVARPVLATASERLRERLAQLARERPLPYDVDWAVENVALQLAGRLKNMMSRTLALELNVARLEGRLEGETPEERFHSFLLQLRQPERAHALLSEYPVLARQIVRTIDHGMTFHAEFLERLAEDWQTICRELDGGHDAGRLVEVTGGAGDSHRKGRSVMLARFDSGFRVVYKPRSLALDVHFQQLLAWLDERGSHPPFRTLTIVDRGDYGWVEFVVPAPCSSADEVDRFYRRQGAYLALLYALDATDFHTDNLVAHGEHPVLLDLEALFHGRVAEARPRSPAHRAVADCLGNSVLRIGLLPQRIWAEGDSEGVDVSGLGSVPDQMTPSPVPQWQKVGTDEMHMGREHMAIAVGDSRPTLGGAAVDLLEHAGAIATGFTDMYRLLEQHRAALLSAEGPLSRFASDEVRVIARSTQTYAVLLRESFHPSVLRDELERARLFDKLWVQVPERPHLARLIPAEVEDLADGDVPMFTTRPDSRDLWSSAGEVIPAFFEESSMAHVRRRIEKLGPADLDRQLWFVRASLATALGAPRAAVRGVPASRAVRPETTPSRDELLALGRSAGDELERRSLREDGAAIWIGLTQPREGRWTLTPLGLDLYDGLPGVALFLGYLAAVSGEDRHAALAQASLRTIRDELAAIREAEAFSVGAFTGMSGVAYALTHLAAVLRDRALLDEAIATVELLQRSVEHDEALDVIGGSAGAIASLLSVYQHTKAPAALAIARRCGERLVERAKPMERGVGWLTGISPETALSGLSHGAAGMAWALLKLAAATGEPRFRKTALEAIAYERTVFSKEQGNWLDLRDGAAAGPARCSTSWCHGAPGIGLARLDTLGLLDDAEVREEIRIAIATTIREGFGGNHCLCHGDLGNLELLASSAAASGDSALKATVSRITRGVLDEIGEGGWRCGNPLRVESPGLMTGLAGIGYGLLRLADPGRVPSMLLLEPPR